MNILYPKNGGLSSIILKKGDFSAARRVGQRLGFSAAVSDIYAAAPFAVEWRGKGGMTVPIIRLSDISKHFRVYRRPEGRWGLLKGAFVRTAVRVQALNGVSFAIERGELVGFIGPNGAGKSTTVKIMSGILTPDGGECVIIGRTPWKERVAHVAQIGVIFGQRSQLWWDVPVGDSFHLLRDIYGIPAKEYGKRQDELTEALELRRLLKTPARQLSLSQRMRCELAAALLHSPQILFLDEPTIGLDAVSKLALRAFLKEENRRSGVTVLLTTHDMDDIAALCDRVLVIGRGQLLYDGPLELLRTKYAVSDRQDIDEIIAAMYRDMALEEA